MFGAKKEKLQHEMAALQEENHKKEQALEEAYHVGNELEEQFAKLAVVNVQIGRNIEALEENAEKTSQLSAESCILSQTLQQDVSQVLEQVQKTKMQQNEFLAEVKKQNADIMDIVEKNKHFTTPMKTLLELPAAVSGENEKTLNELDEMIRLSKNMGVLALNAAIEAGRMGESGNKFIASAEDIRTFAEQYETAAEATRQCVVGMSDRISQMEEEIRRLNQLLKENNISMGRVLKENTAQITAYEKEKVTIDTRITEEMEETSNLLVEKEADRKRLDERLGRQVANIAEEFLEQQTCNSDIEQTSKKLRK